MPPKNGPATAKKGTASAAKASNTDDAVSTPPEPTESTDEGTTAQAAVAVEDAPEGAVAVEADADADEVEVEVEDDKRTPEERAKDEIRKQYPADTELWFGAVKGLWFGFPRVTGITPKRQWLRQIYNLTEIAQTFEWMALAKVPMPIQNRTDALDDDEYHALFNGWFTDAEVTLPK